MNLTIQNYKKLEGFAHDYKDFMIGEIIEYENVYQFRVGYNSTPYTIKIMRNAVKDFGLNYEVLIQDGLGYITFGRKWIDANHVSTQTKTIIMIEQLIQKYKPKYQPVSGNTNFNNTPF